MALLLTDLEEQSEVIAWKDDAFPAFFFCVDIDSSHQDGVGTLDQHQNEKASPVSYPITCFRSICKQEYTQATTVSQNVAE
jgi:hypothetical protein